MGAGIMTPLVEINHIKTRGEPGFWRVIDSVGMSFTKPKQLPQGDCFLFLAYNNLL